MSLLILLWRVLGGIISDQFRGEVTTTPPTQIQSHLCIHILLYNLAPFHTPVEQVVKKTDCASSLIKLCI